MIQKDGAGSTALCDRKLRVVRKPRAKAQSLADGNLASMGETKPIAAEEERTAPDSVRLLSAPVPFVGLIAHHCWFLIERGSVQDRWEVWQHRNAGRHAWGYLHRNLMPPLAPVGAGGVIQRVAFSGTRAQLLAERIETSPQLYPRCHCYFLWPGPNSNTWVAWVLGDPSAMGVKALGRSFARHLPRVSDA